MMNEKKGFLRFFVIGLVSGILISAAVCTGLVIRAERSAEDRIAEYAAGIADIEGTAERTGEGLGELAAEVHSAGEQVESVVVDVGRSREQLEEGLTELGAIREQGARIAANSSGITESAERIERGLLECLRILGDPEEEKYGTEEGIYYMWDPGGL